MKKTILTTLGAAALLCLCQGNAQAQMLTISEVYGGGGNAGSTYSNDFIELYNYGTAAIDMSTLAVYYTNTTGTFSNTAATNFTTVSGTLAAGSYYLIAEAQGTGGTTPLTNVNVTGSINLSATAGKLALGLTSTVPTSTAGAVTAANNPSVIDFIGYGTGANQFKGAAVAPAPSNTNSDARTIVTTASTSNNTDYVAGPPSPQGSGALVVGVPEPSTYASVALGCLGVLAVSRFRRRQA